MYGAWKRGSFLARLDYYEAPPCTCPSSPCDSPLHVILNTRRT